MDTVDDESTESELADEQDEQSEPRKKRSGGASPTARTLAECKRRGWTAGVVERHSPFPRPFGKKHDLFGVIDLIVIVPPVRRRRSRGSILAIQATSSASNHAHRRAKILAEPRSRMWLESGGRLELWSWSKRGGRHVVRKRWTLRVEAFTLDMFPVDQPEP